VCSSYSTTSLYFLHFLPALGSQIDIRMAEAQQSTVPQRSGSTKAWVNIACLVVGALGLVGICFYLFAILISPPTSSAVCELGTVISEPCSCPKGFSKATLSRFCVKKFGELCSSAEECDDNLECFSGRCSCGIQDHTYSQKLGSCVSKVGGPCDLHDSLTCPDNSFCKIFSNQSHGVCECSKGFVVNREGECEAGYEETCSPSIRCDSVAGLACVNGKCRCRNFEEYDLERRACLGLVGSTCKPSRLTSEEETNCVRNAVCTRSHPKLAPTCSCKVGYVVTSFYNCA